jgi:Flp pilus assembly protein TadG
MSQRWRDDTGATAVEFARVALVAFTMMFVGVYAGVYYYYSAAASHIARVVARDASIPRHGSYPTSADETTVAEQAAGTFLPNPTSVTLSAIPRQGEGNELVVTITYQLPGLAAFGNALPFLPHGNGTMTRTVTVRYE